jgi:hypothetical protein
MAATLAHIALCAGSVEQWLRTDPTAWTERLEMLSEMAQSGGARWVTMYPYDVSSNDTYSSGTRGEPSRPFQSGVPDQNEDLAATFRARLVEREGGVPYGDRVVMVARNGVTLIIDTCADGRERLVRAARQFGNGGGLTESQLSATVCAPAQTEPDLLIVLGPANRMSPSVVWEAAYAEIVFLDTPWTELNGEDLEMAIDDFTRRDRRFGGVDS